MKLSNDSRIIDFLNNLFDTNTEFANEHDDKFFAKFKDAQNPHLTILKCSDSRVQMESFDKTPQNGVFAIRNIGNQIATSEGSIDYGIEILNTPFLLIIGHSACGAVTAAFEKTKTEIDMIDRELSTIKLKSETIEQAIIENINTQVDYALEKYRSKVDEGTLNIIGAVYDFKNNFGFGHGRVVLTSINGVTNSNRIKSIYRDKVKNLHFL